MRQATDPERVRTALAYATFVLVGVTIGVSGVLIPAQLDDYGISRSAFGLTFLTGSVGYVASGIATGTVIHRYGVRGAMVLGSLGYVLTALLTAAHPPFVGLVLLQVLSGFGVGLMESVLNVHLAAGPDAAARLNRLHAFFGAGALLGPPPASWLLHHTGWTTVWLILGLIALPLLAAFRWAFPASHPENPAGDAEGGRNLLAATLRSCSAPSCWRSTSAPRSASAPGPSAS
jgi:fucose permease